MKYTLVVGATYLAYFFLSLNEDPRVDNHSFLKCVTTEEEGPLLYITHHTCCSTLDRLMTYINYPLYKDISQLYMVWHLSFPSYVDISFMSMLLYDDIFQLSILWQHISISKLSTVWGNILNCPLYEDIFYCLKYDNIFQLYFEWEHI